MPLVALISLAEQLVGLWSQRKNIKTAEGRAPIEAQIVSIYGQLFPEAPAPTAADFAAADARIENAHRMNQE